MPIPKEDKIYTYKDLKDFPEGERWEIIAGVPYLQASPTSGHQLISGTIFAQLHSYFKGKSCKVLYAPFDVCLDGNESSKNVVQPDIMVVCDKDKLKKNGYFGVPSMVVEILSPSTAKIDRIIKYNKYQEYGVQEYWIVDPINKIIETFILQDGKYAINAYSTDDPVIKVRLFEGLEIETEWIFLEV